MNKRLSNYSFDELLLMPRKQLKELLERTIDSIIQILDSEEELDKNTNNSLIHKHYETDFTK